MISPTCSVSRTADLLSDTEKEILNSLLQYIEERTDIAKQNLVDTLSKLIATSYYLGGDRAAKEIGGVSIPLGLRGLDPVLEKVGTSLDSTFGSMSGELTHIIRSGVRSGWSYDRVHRDLAEKVHSGWGNTIKFDSVGTTRQIVKVAPNGTLSWDTKTITRPVTISTDAYAETLARSSMKQAYTGGHFERYETAGYPGWVYLSVADERTRPRHLALHGRTFLFGTPEEEMARRVMEEYNCRCKPKAWFGDPKRDRPESEYAVQRAEWSRQTFDEWKLDKNMPLLARVNPQSRKDLRALAPQLKKQMSNNDWQILGHQIGMSHDDMVDDTISTIEKNFFFRTLKTGGRENTAVHIYQKHILSDVSRSGESPFTLAEVIKAKDEGIIYKHIDSGGEKLKALYETPDGRRLMAIMSNQYPGKIVTAYRIPESDWKKIVRDGEKLAR